MRLQDAITVTAALTPDKLDTFSKNLDRDWIEEALLSTGAATLRRRRLPAEQTVWLVIGMALMRDRPITDVVQHLELALPGPSKSRTVAPSTVAQARSRLGPEPLEWLFARSAAQWAHQSADRHRWRGLALYGVDGTTARVPDSDENRAHFGGQSAGTTGRGESGYPSVKIAALMALRSHLLVSVDFGPYQTDERNYAATLWSAVPDNSVVLMDRAFLQANVLVPITEGYANRHWLTRAKSNSKWRVLEQLGSGDQLIEMDVSSEALRKDPTLPRARLRRDQDRAPATGGDHSQQAPDCVAQELFGIFIAYNLVRLEMERIADEIGVPPTRVSFVAALRLIVEEWGWATITGSPGAIPRHLADLRDKIRQFLLPPRRSERIYPRAVKLKMSNYARKRPSSSKGRAK